jgi:putative endonuclease
VAPRNQAKNPESDGRRERGQKGEELACKYLRSRGYALVARNWRPGAGVEWPEGALPALGPRAAEAPVRLESPVRSERGGMRGEIDIVAWRDGVLCFVEVKTRSSNLFGAPQEAVTRAKQRQISRLANAFVGAFRVECACRFDVIEVWAPDDGSLPRIALRANAFDFVEC